MSLYGPKTWLAWKREDGEERCCDAFEERTRISLLDALEAASRSDATQDYAVMHMGADAVDDPDSPYRDHVPCTKLLNEHVKRTWKLSPARMQLWDILAAHYFHAYTPDKD